MKKKVPDDHCDWSACRKAPEVNARKHRKPAPGEQVYPRPLGGAYELHFCMEHARIFEEIVPHRIYEPLPTTS